MARPCHLVLTKEFFSPRPHQERADSTEMMGSRAEARERVNSELQQLRSREKGASPEELKNIVDRKTELKKMRGLGVYYGEDRPRPHGAPVCPARASATRSPPFGLSRRPPRLHLPASLQPCSAPPSCGGRRAKGGERLHDARPVLALPARRLRAPQGDRRRADGSVGRVWHRDGRVHRP